MARRRRQQRRVHPRHYCEIPLFDGGRRRGDVMNVRKIVLAGLAAVSLIWSIAPAFAQPAPVPGLPDTERRTAYSISATQCGCSVGFALFGDAGDFQNWV